jgi:hypothetical protein
VGIRSVQRGLCHQQEEARTANRGVPAAGAFNLGTADLHRSDVETSISFVEGSVAMV